MMTTLTIMSVSMSMSLILLSHPLSMGLVLLLQTMTMTVYSSIMYSSSWYSYILFLVMIGGLMILFMYMTSIASNEKFTMNKKIMMTTIISAFIIIILMDNFHSTMMFKKSLITNQYILSSSFNKFWSNPMFSMIIMLFIYLLITMIATIKITNSKNGPLRNLN